jgi:serine/threonine-protein kinase
MGEVFLAEHRNIERKAAIKFLLPEYSSKEELVTRFFTEARAASLIRHPGIVEILDCDVHPSGRAYIIMEFLEGESLRDHLGRVGRLDAMPALAIVRQIAEALAAAHQKGIIHRDLKPDNVYLARSSSGGMPVTVKVLDFGVAKLAASGGGGNMTKTGHLLGTPLYMAPEQCRGTGTVDHRADVYALGCITFELLSGRPPFVREGTGELLLAHITERPPALTSLVASVPAELGALVARMLEKVPERRPQSMIEVAEDVAFLMGAPHAGASFASAPGLAAPAVDTQPGLGPGGGGRRAAITPIAGGTQLLPDRDSTFSSAAAEVTEPVVESIRPRRSGRWWLLALVLLGAAGGAGYRLVGMSPAPTGEQKPRATTRAAEVPVPAVAPVGVAPPVTAPPSFLEVQIASDPVGAELWLEGESRPRGRTPLRLELRRSASPLRAVLKAPGFLDRAFLVDPADSASMVVDMEKVHKEKSRPHRAQPARPKSSGGDETFKPMGD